MTHYLRAFFCQGKFFPPRSQDNSKESFNQTNIPVRGPTQQLNTFPVPNTKQHQSCQYFYTEQNCQTKFYPKKKAQIATVLVLNLNKTNKKDTFREQLLTTLPILLVYARKFYTHSQKRLDLAKRCVLPNFYPNLPIF